MLGVRRAAAELGAYQAALRSTDCSGTVRRELVR